MQETERFRKCTREKRPRYHADKKRVRAAIPRDTSLAPGADDARLTTSRRYTYSQFVTGKLSLISQVTRVQPH